MASLIEISFDYINPNSRLILQSKLEFKVKATRPLRLMIYALEFLIASRSFLRALWANRNTRLSSLLPKSPVHESNMRNRLARRPPWAGGRNRRCSFRLRPAFRRSVTTRRRRDNPDSPLSEESDHAEAIWSDAWCPRPAAVCQIASLETPPCAIHPDVAKESSTEPL